MQNVRKDMGMTKHIIHEASRRGVLQAGISIVAGAAITERARAQDQPQKIAKSLVMYQEQPKDGQHCSICAQFLPPNACKIVAGEINPNGWCAAFAPKGS